MKKMVLFGMGILLLTIISFGCGGNQAAKMDSFSLDDAPTTLRTVKDFPEAVDTIDKIKKKGIIRVITESADDQTHYDALTAARTVGQARILEIIQGVKLNREAYVSNIPDEKGKGGRLTKEEIRTLTEGHIRTFECGAYYDSTRGRGYYCLEVPFRK